MQRMVYQDQAYDYIYDMHVRQLIAQWQSLPNKNEPIAVLQAAFICRSLQMDKNFALLEMFVRVLPNCQIYSENEQIVRAKISVAYERKNFQLVYQLITVRVQLIIFIFFIILFTSNSVNHCPVM